MSKDEITLGIAIIGAGLGVLNLWRDMRKTRRQERVRLEVIPKIGQMRGGTMFSTINGKPHPAGFLVVEVINHSYFPVFVESLYLIVEPDNGQESMVFMPSVHPKKELPAKLDRNEALTLYAQRTNVRELLTIGAKGVFVKTSANQRFEGTSEVLKEIYAQYLTLPKDELGRVDWALVEKDTRPTHPTPKQSSG